MDIKFKIKIISEDFCEILGTDNNDLYRNKITQLVIPTEVTLDGKNYTVTRIGVYAFSCFWKLKDVVLPSKCNSIQDYAFRECPELQSIVIPEGITHIYTGTFYGCNSIQSMTLPKSIVSIEENAFYGCVSLKSIGLPENLKSIGRCAFCGCASLMSIDLPKNLESIGYYAFSGCNKLEEIELPKKLGEIGYQAFKDCTSLKHVIINKFNIDFEDAFIGCTKLTDISLPEGVSLQKAKRVFKYTPWAKTIAEERDSSKQQNANSKTSINSDKIIPVKLIKRAIKGKDEDIVKLCDQLESHADGEISIVRDVICEVKNAISGKQRATELFRIAIEDRNLLPKDDIKQIFDNGNPMVQIGREAINGDDIAAEEFAEWLNKIVTPSVIFEEGEYDYEDYDTDLCLVSRIIGRFYKEVEDEDDAAEMLRDLLCALETYGVSEEYLNNLDFNLIID